MTEPRQLSFEQYLEVVFATPNWLDGCTTMLAAFLEDLEESREQHNRNVSRIAPGIIQQIEGIARRARRLEEEMRATAESRGPEYQTSQLGAVLWWAGMSFHKIGKALEAINGHTRPGDPDNLFFEIHAAMYDLVAGLSLLSAAEGIMARQDAELGTGGSRPN